MIKFNSSKASQGFDVIPEGKYECFVEDGQFKTASTGSPMINWKFKIRNDVEGQQYGGRVLFNNLVFTEKTEGMVHGFLKAIGTPEGKEFKDYQDIINYAKGRAILVNVKVEQYKGNDVNRVAWVEESKVGGGRVDDPFASSTDTSLNISEDDLPF